MLADQEHPDVLHEDVEPDVHSRARHQGQGDVFESTTAHYRKSVSPDRGQVKSRSGSTLQRVSYSWAATETKPNFY